MGDTNVQAPASSAAEQELQRAQVATLKQQSTILNEQFRMQNLLTPVLLKAQGLNPVFDQSGKIIGLSEDPGSIQARRLGLEEKLLAREEAALEGKLPVDPALLRNLQEEEQTVRETLRKQVGPDYELSTPGSQRLSDFMKRKEELIDAARRGDLTLSEQLSISRQGSVQQGIQGGQNVLFGMPLTLASAFGGASQNYNAPLQFMQQDRQMQMQAAIQNARSSAARTGAIIGAVGTVAGASIGAGGAAGGISNVFR